ncbi:hypothetical protein ECZU29_55940 [Escherichia coli]|nr:hypothetical protein ECZU29_55940 [Escherichia coli]
MSSNFRHQLLSLSLLVGIAAPWAAYAQAPISSVGSGSVEDRVTQLERISNAHSQLLTQLQQQLSDNQSDIDSLRGQIQENQYQLNQVVERQKQILLQIDSLSSGGAAAQSTSGDQSGAAASTTPTADAGTANAGAPVKAVMQTRITMQLLRWCRINPARMTQWWHFRISSKITLIQLTCQTPIIGWVS